jgi:hypothetical protein
MTLAPSRALGPRFDLLRDDTWCVTYELEAICYVPDCTDCPERGSHHIEPRSRTGGPVDFVVIDALVVHNTVRLCSLHHQMVTGDIGGHRARILWLDGAWCWQERTKSEVVPWLNKGPLKEVKW